MQVLAAATSQPAGYNHTGKAVLAYEAIALDVATSRGASASLALDRLAVLWGVADGAINGTLQAEHQRMSDEMRAAVGIGKIPVNLLLTKVPHPIVAIGLDVAVGHLEQETVRLLTPDQPSPVHIRPPDADPIQQYFAEASATFRDSELWDGPELRGDSEVLLTAASDGATLYQRYTDTSAVMQQAIVNAATNAGRK
ncbi:hypothetical protein Cfla_3310 [Cellulomonas flavigena DSM 20109]|uniref:Uncharacterized protein n=1 Tax=Cellulomonas flavigena (strain ATCC 482 / DSM 20109 / BCRC 11376 / JCM 18109 / NBRC 3775 / NCIMB 8073 / NRS 134) TaxID=446466 RepID=D5UC30_CELFN|nr:hypothetical protein [Cellulomonas flavigena]ADG76189.1 hypothetical protein Cfla_3310 [Cellulomonas flavigena DSM 20109]